MANEIIEQSPEQEHVLCDVSRAVSYLIDKHIKGTVQRIDLELHSGISIRAIYYWRQRGHDPKISNFIAFANALGYEVLMRRKEAPRLGN